MRAVTGPRRPRRPRRERATQFRRQPRPGGWPPGSVPSGRRPPTPAAAASGIGASTIVNLSQVTLRIGDQAGTGAESLLKAAGLLAQLPFKVSWSDFPSGPPMLQAMGAGAIDVGGVGDAPPVFAAAGGAKIAIVGATETGPTAPLSSCPRDRPSHSISQLRGKTIAVAQGSSADYHLLTVLNKAGLTVHEVTLDYLQPAEGLAALESGKVDAWDVWTPYIEEVVDDARRQGPRQRERLRSQVQLRCRFSGRSRQPGQSGCHRRLPDRTRQSVPVGKAHPGAWATNWAQGTGLPLRHYGPGDQRRIDNAGTRLRAP